MLRLLLIGGKRGLFSGLSEGNRRYSENDRLGEEFLRLLLQP
jgi:hypothetical protein